MFNTVLSYIWGDHGSIPTTEDAIDEHDSDFDTRSEEGEWIVVGKGEHQPNAISASILLKSQSSPDVHEIQPMPISRRVASPKKSKSRKAAKELGKSQPGSDKASLASKMFAGVLLVDRHNAAKVSDGKAFRSNKKSMERNNKVVMVASGQKKCRDFNINLRFNQKMSRAC